MQRSSHRRAIQHRQPRLDVQRGTHLQSLHAVVPCAMVLVLAAILAAVPHTTLDALPSFCLWHRLDLPCWGCGTVRSLSALLHADWGSAWRHNPNIIVTAPLLAGIALTSCQRTIRAALHPC